MTNRFQERRFKRMDITHLEQDPGYKKVLELDFGEMIPFVLTHIKKKSIVSFLYAAANLGLFVYLMYFLIKGLTDGDITWSLVFRQSITGIFAGSFLIIPFHELIHGLAYKIFGAKKIQFGADMQQFIFYVTVDRYPVSRWQLYLLAMLPFVFINLTAILVLLLWFPQLTLFVGFLLLSHNLMCIGDFAVVNYVYHIPGKVYSYDVVSERKSYFFSQEVRGNTDH